MSLEFNIGEYANRARKALGVRGRIPLDVDERLSFQVALADLDRAPWRQDGARFGVWLQAGAVAANFSNFAIGCVGANTIVVDRIGMQAPVVNYGFVGKVQNQPAGRAWVAAPSPEQNIGRAAGGAAQADAKSPASFASVVVPANTITFQGSDFYIWSPTVSGTVFQDVEITIAPGWELLLENQIINQSSILFVGGRAYSQQVPL